MLIIFIMVLIFYAIIYSKNAREQEQKFKLLIQEKEMMQLRELFHVVESERETIATALQNDTNTLLAALSTRIEKYKYLLNEGSLTEDRFNDDIKTINEAMNQIHQASQNLSPMFLHRFGLAEALKASLENKKECEVLVMTDMLKEDKLPDVLISNVYRIVIDLIAELAKQYEIKKMEVNLRKDNQEILILIKYFDRIIEEASIEHLIEGKNYILSRLVVINGQWSADQKEARIRIQIPVDKDE